MVKPNSADSRGSSQSKSGQKPRKQGFSPSNKRSMFLQKAAEATTKALGGKDVLLANVSRVIDETVQVANALGERLEELYGIYLPELRLEDRRKYCEIIMVLDKTNPDAKELSKIVGSGKSNEIITLCGKSIGAPLTEEDLLQCRNFANQLLMLYKFKDQYAKYLETLTAEVCPNISAVAGSDIAAKLISHVGSLARLSILPSSTIQVLGAEKALFKHLKNRKIDPPKHGIIFQHVRISASPKVVRGKIARALANSIALAAKADHFTKKKLGDLLIKRFDDRYTQIMDEYKKQKEKALVPAPSESKSGS
ncbi:TPA: hypothetical protein HA238_03820 [Candidatus Micrarchaeota archaeon]|nr:hypothetical protein [Candidatus Micrarchaeota archaeon]